MELRATSFQVVAEDDDFLSYAFFRDPHQYFSITRPTARAGVSARIQSEANDQAWQTEIDPKICVLRRDRLEIEYGSEAALQLGGNPSITVYFPPDALADLRVTLAEIFRDRRIYHDLSQEDHEGKSDVSG